jgi:hypothetical protein
MGFSTETFVFSLLSIIYDFICRKTGVFLHPATPLQSQQITCTLQCGKYSQKKRHTFPVAQQLQNEGKVEPVHTAH